MNSTEQAAAPLAEATRHPLSAVSRWHGRSSWATSLFFRRLLLGPQLQRELTCDGLRAAEAKGDKGGRRPAVPAAKTDTARASYLKGRSIAALARDHGVSRDAIRTAVAGLLPDHIAIEEDAPAPEPPVALDVPGKVPDFLRTTELEPAERAALDPGGDRTTRPGLHPARQRRPHRAPRAPGPLPTARRSSGRSDGSGTAQDTPRVREPGQRLSC